MPLFTFKHGVHPQEQKTYSQAASIETLPLPDDVYVPLQQHIGRPCSPLVSKKDEVKTGQIIAKAEGFVSSPIHSPVTGIVKDIGLYMHSMGQRIPMIHIQRTGDDDWQNLEIPTDWEKAPSDQLEQLVFEAGIVGMGGAAFPAHVKFKTIPEKPIDTFILNGCECEPFLTCDHRMMIEKTDEILLGMAIIVRILKVDQAFIGVESNKPDAIEKLQERVIANGYNFKVIPLKVKYPQGAEKMLIKAVTKRDVPAGGLPGDVGVIVSNVGTANAVKEAVIDGKPLINRIVAVTGDALNSPKNLETRIGTSIQTVIDYCGGLKEDATQVIMGGPMMGFSQFDLSVPVVKATSGIVCTKFSEFKQQKTYPCIRCNSCVSACPMFLLPNRLSRQAEKGMIEDADTLGIMNCIECGSCVYVCPSRIPILQWLRLGKYKVNELRRKSAV